MTDHATCIEEIMKSYHILYISLTLFGALFQDGTAPWCWCVCDIFCKYCRIF